MQTFYPFLIVVVFRLRLHVVCMSRGWFGVWGLVRHAIGFWLGAVWCRRGFGGVVCRRLSAGFAVVAVILFAFR
jgi:hypothetical protein